MDYLKILFVVFVDPSHDEPSECLVSDLMSSINFWKWFYLVISQLANISNCTVPSWTYFNKAVTIVICITCAGATSPFLFEVLCWFFPFCYFPIWIWITIVNLLIRKQSVQDCGPRRQLHLPNLPSKDVTIKGAVCRILERSVCRDGIWYSVLCNHLKVTVDGCSLMPNC